ncbi:hypothetical protein PCLA_04r0615 [Pseudomonas citronellolis]|nr:hypothetical protein PCLA_04r0615 [Pseudomonas citronellolis]
MLTEAFRRSPAAYGLTFRRGIGSAVGYKNRSHGRKAGPGRSASRAPSPQRAEVSAEIRTALSAESRTESAPTVPGGTGVGATVLPAAARRFS